MAAFFPLGALFNHDSYLFQGEGQIFKWRMASKNLAPAFILMNMLVYSLVKFMEGKSGVSVVDIDLKETKDLRFILVLYL